jgi:superfamily II DNA or RNA helicase
MELRPYQERIVEATEETLAFDNTAIITLPPGGGKTIVAATIAQQNQDRGEYTVILTNMSALIPQIARHLEILNIKHNIIKANNHKTEKDAFVTIIMEQSFHEKARETLDVKCDYLIKDEVHQGMGKPRFESILKHLNPTYMIGLTATPITEKGYLLPGIDQSNMINEIDIKTLTKEGFLAPIKYYIPKWSQEVDYSEVSVSGNDYSTRDIDNIVNTQNHTNSVLQSMNAMDAKNKKTLVFTSSIEHAERIYNAMVKEGYSVAVVHSEMNKSHNEEMIANFKGEAKQTSLDEDQNKEIMALVSISQLSIGFDAPKAQLLVMLRKTRILRLYLQLGMRVGRPHPDKEYAEFLDLAQCVQNLGWLDQPIPMIKEGDRKALQSHKESLENPVITSLVGSEPTEITQEMVFVANKELKEKEENVLTLTLSEMISVFEISRDYKKCIEIGFEINKRSRGKQYLPKDVEWCIKPWTEFINDFPDMKGRIINTLKTRLKNIVKGSKNIKSIHYFPDFLRTVEPYKFRKAMSEFMDEEAYEDIECPF